MSWASVGSISIGPADGPKTIGAFTLDVGADTLWVRAVQQGGDSPFPYGFGLLTWETLEGRELGTCKVFGHHEGETYRLGVGLSPMERSGVLKFWARPYSLKWLKVMSTTWNLAFEARSGVTIGGGTGAIAGSFVTSQDVGLELARVVFP